tara:strand:+ start:1251 stop:1832 length:582 start_codon:yes stop_codon:yes gene_type:complete
MEASMNDSHGHSEDEIRQGMEEVLKDLPSLLKHFQWKVIHLVMDFNDFQQEVSAGAWKSLSSFKPGSDLMDSLRAFVFAIAKYKYADCLTKASKAINTIQDQILSQAASKGLTPSRIMGKQDGLTQLHECLLKLDEQDRAIIIMRIADGKSSREVSERFETTQSKINTRVENAVERLRECWGSSGAYRFLAGE